VPTVPIQADTGAMGGRDSHEFMFLTDVGEDSCLFCPGCGYAANAEIAAFVKEPAHSNDAPLALEEIDTPGQKTIADLATFLSIPTTKTAKAVFYTATFAGDDGELRGEPVLVSIRGDMDVNEIKLRNALGAIEVKYMDDAAVRKAGFVAGSAGAVKLKGAKVVADELITRERNLTAGANTPDKHFINTNYERDWTADIVADIALAGEGSLCANCRTPMDVRRGIEMGHIFKLGTHYSEKMGALFLDAEGKQRPAIMGSYGIGLERLLAAAIEAKHDENGIIWPDELAPFKVHIVVIQADKPGVREEAERLYDGLRAAGVEVLLDDRDETPGVKFNDADLLGIPLRATVSPRNLEKGSVEVRARTAAESEMLPLDGALEAIRGRVAGK
jgi:prolyl-tRNA synthetase